MDFLKRLVVTMQRRFPLLEATATPHGIAQGIPWGAVRVRRMAVVVTTELNCCLWLLEPHAEDRLPAHMSVMAIAGI